MFRIGHEEINAVKDVIESRELFKVNSSMHAVENAEKKLREIMGVDYAIMMTSGKAALISALIALGIGPGDEVIVPGYTYIASAIAVVAVGAIPVIAEVDETLTLDANDVEKKVSKYTKAIMPVHIQGFPSNMDALKAVAEKHGLFIVEDSCQADGGRYHGKRLGTIGDAGAYSFNYYKVITAGGEGGALVTNNRQIFERGLIYHDSSAIAYFGNQLDSITEPVFCGTEYRVGEVMGAILGAQLDRLDSILADLRRIHNKITSAVSDVTTFVPSNDRDGACCTTVALRFESEKEARAFAISEGVNGTLPIDTGKHVYTNWTPIMEKRGALNPLSDPFKRPENAHLNMNYSPDMCPKTLEYLSRSVYIPIHSEWSDDVVESKIAAIRRALSDN